MDYSLLLAIASCALAALSIWRAYVPPQSRQVSELRGRMEDVEFDLAELHKRMHVRARSANMEKAREVAEQGRERRSAIEEQALAVIQSAKASPPAAAAQDPEAARRALRAQVFGPVKH